MKTYAVQKPLHPRSKFVGILAVVAGISLLLVGRGYAVLTFVTAVDAPNCDSLAIPEQVHEIGLNPAFPQGFPQNELLSAQDLQPTMTQPCPLSAVGVMHPVLSITNMTGLTWKEVWYVPDHDTSLTNYDGFIASPNGQLQTFKIDSVGNNQPLIFESIAANNIWEPNETWHFIIQDYLSGPGYLPSALNSVGLDSPFLGPPATNSSGSIIALEIPEPGSLVLFLLSGFAYALRRRR